MGDVETLKTKIVSQCRGDIEVPAFIADVDALVAAVRAENTTALDAAEALFAVMANVDSGDWTSQAPEWVEAAHRARDLYHAALDKVHPPVGGQALG